MTATAIEWVRNADGSPGMSWNALRAERQIERRGVPVTVSAHHCEKVNRACQFCYAERGNPRLGGLAFKRGHRDAYRFVLDRDKLLAPLNRRKPTRIFVESMSDAFGEWWPRWFRDALYAVMALTPQHTYVNLTKRPEERQQYLDDPALSDRLDRVMNELAPAHWCTRELDDFGGLPLKNVIEGTSCSNQEEVAAFVPIVLRTKAARRAVSLEPLLGPVDLREILVPDDQAGKYAGHGYTFNAFAPKGDLALFSAPAFLDWVIVGGESGSSARPTHAEWVRSLRDQCAAAGVPFFFKQWGEYLPVGQSLPGHGKVHGATAVKPGRMRLHYGGTRQQAPKHAFAERGVGFASTADGRLTFRVGKKAAGRLLDGVEHNGYPGGAVMTDLRVVEFAATGAERSGRSVLMRHLCGHLRSLGFTATLGPEAHSLRVEATPQQLTCLARLRPAPRRRRAEPPA